MHADAKMGRANPTSVLVEANEENAIFGQLLSGKIHVMQRDMRRRRSVSLHRMIILVLGETTCSRPEFLFVGITSRKRLG